VYRLEVSHIAHHQIRRLPTSTQDRIDKAIVSLAQNPRPFGSTKLTVTEGYRVRVGDYRILYQINDGQKLITVYRVMARGDVYRF
jgi:mRNA interferase RelE/StbE